MRHAIHHIRPKHARIISTGIFVASLGWLPVFTETTGLAPVNAFAVESVTANPQDSVTKKRDTFRDYRRDDRHHRLIDRPSVPPPISTPSSTPPVSSPPPANLGLGASPTSFSFTATQGGNNPAAKTLSVSTTGGGTLAWSASNSAPWLTLSQASGTGKGSVTLTATTGTLTAGIYSGAVTLSPTGATAVTVPVTFTVNAAATMTVSPTSLSFTATQGAANPASQSMTVSSNGTWTVSKSATWLTVSPASGSNTGTITASVNTVNATLGTNTATITVTGGGMTQTEPVTLTLNAPATSSATLMWNPSTATNIASYRVYRSTTPGVYAAALATVQNPATAYVATGLPVGTTYYFTVTAVDSAGNESPHSNEASKSIF
jgi:hypothetical protein